MQFIVYAFFIFFVVVLIIVGIYFIISTKYREYNKQMIKTMESTTYNRIHSVLLCDKNNRVQSDIELLKENFTSKRGVQAFYQAYKRYVNDFGLSDDLRDLLSEVVAYKKIVKSKQVKESYSKSYALNLIADFYLDSQETTKFAMDSLNDSSLYVRNNAIRVIQNQKDSDCLIKALDKVNNYKGYYNNKILVDVLDNFAGDQLELDQKLVKKLNDYEDSLVNAIIDHLINTKNDCINVKNQMLSLLFSSNNNETIMKTTRYFSYIEDARAKSLIINNMTNTNWSIRAVSVDTIGKYADDEVIKLLKQRVKDVNYFVRRNSAMTLIKILSKDELFKFTFNSNDKFASEILEYSMESKKIKGYTEYKAKRLAVEKSWLISGT